jgi:hypothetical protein
VVLQAPKRMSQAPISNFRDVANWYLVTFPAKRRFELDGALVP